MRRTAIGHPLWTWAVLLAMVLAIGFYASWDSHGDLWSWPVLVMLATFGVSLVLERRRVRANAADAARDKRG